MSFWLLLLLGCSRDETPPSTRVDYFPPPSEGIPTLQSTYVAALTAKTNLPPTQNYVEMTIDAWEGPDRPSRFIYRNPYPSNNANDGEPTKFFFFIDDVQDKQGPIWYVRPDDLLRYYWVNGQNDCLYSSVGGTGPLGKIDPPESIEYYNANVNRLPRSRWEERWWEGCLGAGDLERHLETVGVTCTGCF